MLGGVLPGAVLAADQYDIIARTGDAAGDTGGGVFSSFGTPVINDVGQLAYEGALLIGTGGVHFGNDNGLWRDSTLIARDGGSAGGTSGGLFQSFGTPVINNAGQLAYMGILRQIAGGVTPSNNTGLWRDSTLIVREGDSAGFNGEVFSSFDNPVMNDAGQLAYEAFRLQGTGGVTADNDRGLWRDSTLIEHEGRFDRFTNGVFSSFSNPVMNDAGQLAYDGLLRTGTAGVTSDNDNGIWRDSTLIVREGDSAGGVNGGVFSSFGTPDINNAGQLAYEGFLHNGTGGVTSSNDRGLWRDSTLIARSGSSAGDTSGGVFSSFDTPVMNNAGQVAYEAFLLLGTGGVNSGNDRGVWLGSTLLAREGFQAAGAPTGARFGGSFGSLSLNDGGQVAFANTLQTGPGGVSSADNFGLWLYGPNGEGLLVAREGDSFDGKVLSGFSLVGNSGGSDGRASSLNEFGQLAYRAEFTDSSQAQILFTPDIHWTADFSSDWESSFRWTLEIDPGDPHAVFIDPSSSLTVFGPGSNVNMRELTIGGGSGIATLDLGFGAITSTDGTTVAATGVLSGDGVINGGVTNTGEVRAENVTINGGLINNGLVNGTTGARDRINANITNNTGGEVRVGVGESLHLSGSSHTNNGRIEVDSGELEVDGGLTNNTGSQIFADDATLRFNGDVTNNTGAQIFADNATLRFNGGLTNDGQLNVTFGGASLFGDMTIGSLGQVILSGSSNTTFFDDVTNNGELRVSPGSVATFFGDVMGPGNYTGTGTKFYEALFSPGSSPGLVSDDGDALFGAGAVVVMEIGGSVQGIDYDHYDVAGLLGLDGSLVVSLLDGYTPGEGEVFDLFDWGTLSGSFFALDLSGAALAAGLAWDLSGLYTSGALTVSAAPVPLPAGMWLMISGLVVLARKRLRHSTQ